MPEPKKPFMGQLSDKYKENEYIAGLGDDWNPIVEELLKFRETVKTSTAELQTAQAKLKNAVIVPGEDATDEEKQTFRRSLGIPESIDDYVFKTDDAVMDKLEDPDFFAALKKNLFDLGVNPVTGSAVAKLLNDKMVKLKDLPAQQRKDAQSELLKTLTKKHGEEGLNKRIASIRKFMVDYAPKAVPELLKKYNLDNDLEVTAVFDELAAKFDEDQIKPGSTGGKGPQEAGQLAYKGMDESGSE
ncbi:MAG TPA: hypothetical protein ENH40_02445 [Nitrospirae bacterium]|nr:hypothetical protein [Nitrospirota bacterium]